MSPPDASACRTATRSSTPQAHLLHLALLELFPLFDSLCLSDCLWTHSSLLFPSKISVFVLILSRRSSWCGFVAFPCDASAAHPGQPPVCTWNLLGSTSGALSTTILGNGSPAPSLSAVSFFVNFNSGATICHGMPHKPSQSVNAQASLKVCLVQLLPRTTPFLVMYRADTVFSNVAKPNFLSKLRHWLSPSSNNSPHFTRFAVFLHSHLVHDLRCKKRKSTV